MKKINDNKFKIKNRGMALMQGLIVAAMVAAASALVVNYSSLQQTNSHRAIGTTLSNSITSIVSNLLSTQRFCNNTFAGVNFSNAGGQLSSATGLVIRDAENNPIITPGAEKIGKVTIDDIIIVYPAGAPWPNPAVGGSMAQISSVTLQLSFMAGVNSRVDLTRTIPVTELPFIAKDGAGNFLGCEQNTNSAVTAAVQQACEAMGGTFTALPNPPDAPKCNLNNSGNPITGINPNNGDYATTAAGLELINEYYDTRYLRTNPVVIPQVFQANKGITVDRLDIASGAVSSSDALVNIRQVREAVQSFCAGAGVNVFGVFTQSGIRCVDLMCPAGSYLSEVLPDGTRNCREFISPANGISTTTSTSGAACPTSDNDIYQFTVNAIAGDPNEGKVSINCCTPDCSDSAAYLEGVSYTEQYGCGSCVGSATNNLFQCAQGLWQPLNECQVPAVTPAACTGGAAQPSGTVICCPGTPPISTCSPPPTTYGQWICTTGTWNYNGSCPGGDDPECVSGAADGQNICCSTAPSGACGSGGGGACGPLTGSSCTSDAQCGTGGQCNGMGAGSGACEVSQGGPDSCAVFGNAGAGAVPAGEECTPSEPNCGQVNSRYYPIATLCGNLFSQNTCDNSGFIKLAHSCSSTPISHCSWNPTGGGAAGTCGCTPSNNLYGCFMGGFTASLGGPCSPVDTVKCAGGSTVNDGESICCSSAPAGGNCQAPSGSFEHYTCNSSNRWELDGSCSGPTASSECPSMNTTATQICCDPASPPSATASCTYGGAGNTSGQCAVYPSNYTSQPANAGNGCIDGSFTEIADTATEWRWRCDGSGTGTDANCSANRIASTTEYVCDSGNVLTGGACSAAATANGCNPPPAGPDPTGYQMCCTSPPPNAWCGGTGTPGACNTSYTGTYASQPATNTANGCTSGTYSNTPADTAGQWFWSCVSGDGGGDATCSANRGAAVVNGSCQSYTGTYSSQPANNTASGCTAGTFVEVADSTHSWLWRCDGSGGGSNATCNPSRGRNYRCMAPGDFGGALANCNSVSSVCTGPLQASQGATICCDNTPSDAYCSDTSSTSSSSSSSSGCSSNTCTGGSSCISYCPGTHQCRVDAGNCPVTAPGGSCIAICTTAGNHACWRDEGGSGNAWTGMGCF